MEEKAPRYRTEGTTLRRCLQALLHDAVPQHPLQGDLAQAARPALLAGVLLRGVLPRHPEDPGKACGVGTEVHCTSSPAPLASPLLSSAPSEGQVLRGFGLC